jgi:hypothetical protein
VIASTWAELVAELAIAVELVLVVAVVVLWRAIFETRRRPSPPELEDPIEREPFDQDAPRAPQTRRVGGTAKDRPGGTREEPRAAEVDPGPY